MTDTPERRLAESAGITPKRRMWELVDVEGCLRDMRATKERWLYLETLDDYEDAFKNLAACFSALDEALSHGRELPRDWQKDRPAPEAMQG